MQQLEGGSDVSLMYFEELFSVDDTHSGRSQLDPSPAGGRVVLPTCGVYLQLYRPMQPWQQVLFRSRLFTDYSSVLHRLAPPGMYEQHPVLQ
jgi:hypothetical protein